MNAELLIYGLILIPFIGTIVAGYARLRVGPFFGITLALGAISIFLSYLLLDLQAALLQLAALGIGTILFLALVGIFGERFSYRSPQLVLASVGLFPLGFLLGVNYLAPLATFGILFGLNLLFATLLAYLRRNNIADRKGRPRAKSRYILTVPAILTSLVVGLMVLIELGNGALI